MKHSHSQKSLLKAPVSAVSLAMLALGWLAATPAQAFEINTGNDDVVVRWDNSLRYTYGRRMQQQDPNLSTSTASANNNDGNRNFNPDQQIANRLDLLSEFDVVVDKKYGGRVSGTAWTDGAYSNLQTNSSTTNYNTSSGGGTLSDYSRRYAAGPSGELLDAFVFASFDAGDVPVSARLGRHTAFWGEGLLLGGAINGVSYGQYALDIWKSNASPGAEAKELYRPRNGLTMQIQPTSDLTIAGQAFFDWEAARLPESGTYLGGTDVVLYGGDNYLVAGSQPQGKMTTPNKTGDWGLSARWSPEWLNGTAGLYVRRTSDILPQVAASIGNGYYFSYASNIDIFGLSLSQNIAGLSVGMEFNVRKNMPLSSSAVTSASLAQLQGLAASGDVPGARGDTAHGVLTLVGIASQNMFFDAASYGAELAWNRVLKVATDPFNSYKGRDAYADVANNYDATSRDATTIGLIFTPQWFNVLPSVNLSMPVSYSRGLNGNSGVSNGGSANSGSYSVGVSAELYSRYTAALQYVGAFGPFNAANLSSASSQALLSDRGMLLLTLKATF